MQQMLRERQVLQLEPSAVDCEVEQFLGAGGQGEVYRANIGDRQVALKWYYPHVATMEQMSAIEELIKRGRPTPKFLWPESLVSSRSISGFGYVMPLREPQFKGFLDLMKKKVDPSFKVLATVGLWLSHSFLQLHSKGLCYRDISFANVFFDPATGDIRICDNDNVGIDNGGIAVGTHRFMAPEVVRGEVFPNTQTDLFSLAVLLFYIMIMHHPLEGEKESRIKCLDIPAMKKLYGTEPLFIFDPYDKSNRPVKGFHDNALIFWPLYPQFLRELFTKAFTEGIKDPTNGRVRESEWRFAMVQLVDSIFYCQNCGSEIFYDLEVVKNTGVNISPCWSCGNKDIILPYRMKIGKRIIMLNHDTKLYPHHTDLTRMYDFTSPDAEVARHPNDPNMWGLKNLSSNKWVVKTHDGTLKDVLPGRSIAMADGIIIQFGNSEGEIKY